MIIMGVFFNREITEKLDYGLVFSYDHYGLIHNLHKQNVPITMEQVNISIVHT